MEEKIAKIIAQYHSRIQEEQKLMDVLPLEEGMNRRDEFLLSVGEEVAVFLNALVKKAKPTNVLEIGTSYGYSTMWLAEAVRTYGGKVITLENDERKAMYAQQKLSDAGLSDYVEIVIGDALEFLKQTNQTFDFVLLDLWKELYIPSFDLFYPKLNSSAIVISDNMIFPPHSRDEMDIYRNHLKNTNAFDTVLLPLGSGIEISRLRN